MTQYPALNAFLERGSIADISRAPVDVIKEVQSILGITVDGLAGTQTINAFAKWKTDNHQNQPTILGSGSIKLLLAQASAAKPMSAAKGKTYLYLTKTDRSDSNGLRILLLEYVKDGQVKGSLEVCSGAPGRQSFRKGTDSRSGSLEPLPEGRYRIGDIAWADGKDNYSGGIFAAGLGPVTVPLQYDSGYTQRSAIEGHLDFNRSTAPGTAGCVGFYRVSEYKVFVSWLRESDPDFLFVDWKLGTCPKP